MIILKVTKNQGFTLCLEDTIFKKPQGSGGGVVGGVGGQLGLSTFLTEHLQTTTSTFWEFVTSKNDNYNENYKR